uniref:Uncharacterized protein n=1 Tax=Oryza barthii TaxID=65489 RepID=A0A0D3HB38_9ORYZ
MINKMRKEWAKCESSDLHSSYRGPQPPDFGEGKVHKTILLLSLSSTPPRHRSPPPPAQLLLLLRRRRRRPRFGGGRRRGFVRQPSSLARSAAELFFAASTKSGLYNCRNRQKSGYIHS